MSGTGEFGRGDAATAKQYKKGAERREGSAASPGDEIDAKESPPGGSSGCLGDDSTTTEAAGRVLPEKPPPARRDSSSVTVDTAPTTSTTKRSASCSSAVTTLEANPHVHAGGLTDDSLKHCYSALEMVFQDDKKGWEQAKERCCPRVLERESCPCYFMVACHSNPWEAAQRLCTYWRERINLFQGRAFDAITIGSEESSSKGLTSEDVEVLETGFFQLLPNDRQGRSVTFGDQARLAPYMLQDTKNRLRAMWYVLHKAYMSGAPQSHRLVSIVLVSPPRRPDFDWSYASACVRLPSILPLQGEDIHLLTLPAPSGAWSLMQAMISVVFGVIGSFAQHWIKVHHGATVATKATSDGNPCRNLFRQLHQFGFSRSGLPPCAGGSFSNDSFCAWIRKQRRIEAQWITSHADREQRRREQNRLHSRTKRIRRSQEFELLQYHVQELREANAKAKETRTFLECLLQQACFFVEHMDVDRSTAAPPTVSVSGLKLPCTLSGAIHSLPPVTPSSVLTDLEPTPLAPNFKHCCLPRNGCQPYTPNVPYATQESLPCSGMEDSSHHFLDRRFEQGEFPSLPETAIATCKVSIVIGAAVKPLDLNSISRFTVLNCKQRNGSSPGRVKPIIVLHDSFCTFPVSPSHSTANANPLDYSQVGEPTGIADEDATRGWWRKESHRSSLLFSCCIGEQDHEPLQVPTSHLPSGTLNQSGWSVSLGRTGEHWCVPLPVQEGSVGEIPNLEPLNSNDPVGLDDVLTGDLLGAFLNT